mgnify:CR=1 FL=1
MNKQIFDFLNEYAKLPSPQYAVLLRGKWGCGKTYFVKHWLEEFDKSGKLHIFVIARGNINTRADNALCESA